MCFWEILLIDPSSSLVVLGIKGWLRNLKLVSGRETRILTAFLVPLWINHQPPESRCFVSLRKSLFSVIHRCNQVFHQFRASFDSISHIWSVILLSSLTLSSLGNLPMALIISLWRCARQIWWGIWPNTLKTAVTIPLPPSETTPVKWYFFFSNLKSLAIWEPYSLFRNERWMMIFFLECL